MRNLREFPGVENALRRIYERMGFKMGFGERGKLSA